VELKTIRAQLRVVSCGCLTIRIRTNWPLLVKIIIGRDRPVAAQLGYFNFLLPSLLQRSMGMDEQQKNWDSKSVGETPLAKVRRVA
jgi:hypothetical protein